MPKLAKGHLRWAPGPRGRSVGAASRAPPAGPTTSCRPPLHILLTHDWRLVLASSAPPLPCIFFPPLLFNRRRLLNPTAAGQRRVRCRKPQSPPPPSPPPAAAASRIPPRRSVGLARFPPLRDPIPLLARALHLVRVPRCGVCVFDLIHSWVGRVAGLVRGVAWDGVVGVCAGVQGSALRAS